MHGGLFVCFFLSFFLLLSFFLFFVIIKFNQSRSSRRKERNKYIQFAIPSSSIVFKL